MTKSILIAALALGASGCVSLEMNRIQRDIADDIESTGQAEVGKGFSMAFGRGTIGTSRFLGRMFAPTSTEPYRRLSRHVRQVKVARFPITGALDASLIERPDALARFAGDGWYPFVTVRDSTERVWLLLRETDDEVLTDLLAVVVSGEDLVLTRMSGNLSDMILDAGALIQSDLLQETLDGVVGADPTAARSP